MKENVIEQKSLEFAMRIVKLCQYLRKEKREEVMSKQLLRSGTSIGANIAEAQYGQTKKDFYAKLTISLKEAAESRYWLRLLHYGEYLSEQQYRSINEDCEEIIKLLTAITKSAKEGINY